MLMPQDSKLTTALRDGNIQSGGDGCERIDCQVNQVKKRMGISNGQSARRPGLNESSIYGEWISPGKANR